MDFQVVQKKFLGCIIGAAIGDTVGAPLEFWERERIAKHPQGTEWIEDMLPFVGMHTHPAGLWRLDPPRGTATDDTRLNQVFVEAVSKYGLLINSKLLAAEYIDRYVNRDQYYPGYSEFSTQQFAWFLPSACGQLGIECPTLPGVPAHALTSHAGGLGIPILMGLLMTPSAGLLHPGDPEAAYKHAFELAYDDIGYAKDATAILAAMIAASFDEETSPRDAIRKGLEIDPFNLGARQRRTMVTRINQFLEFADEAQSDRELVMMVSKAVQRLHPYDPIDVLGLPVAACYRANGDPRRAILMSVNDRDFDEKGEFKRYRDIDCTGSVCGALVGALAPGGIDDLPADWVATTVSANREEYGFDIEANARRMYEVVAATR